MLEMLLCATFTVLPDYLFRRYVQGKRIGREITLYSVWFELRWGIVSCVVLTVLLITMIFYFHPSTSSAATFFRTVPILPEGSGRVEEIFVDLSDAVEAGDPLFRLDASSQEAALETARRRVAEVDASGEAAEAQLAAAEANVRAAEAALADVEDQLGRRQTLLDQNSPAVTEREVAELRNQVDGLSSALEASRATRDAAETQLTRVVPAQRETAQAALSEAQAALDKTVVYAGVSGRVEQFTLRVGDVVNPFMRPAGILVPREAGRQAVIAGFGQIESGVIRPGMAGEAACMSKPFQVIPLRVQEVQGVIAAGQVNIGDRLIDPGTAAQPGTLTVILTPMFPGALDGVFPGSSCIVNAYTDNHERLEHEDLGAGEAAFLHAVDATGVVHAVILRIQALTMPIGQLVFSGGH